MFMSKLIVRKSGPGCDWLRRPYRVHQRLCMAFPAVVNCHDGKFDPVNFSHNINVRRNESHGFLFHINNDRYNPYVLVQSAQLPDWKYALESPGYDAKHIVDSFAVKEVGHSFNDGDEFTFKLRAIPTRRRRGPSDGKNGRTLGIDSLHGRREWFIRKGDEYGFRADFDVYDEGLTDIHKLRKDGDKSENDIRRSGIHSILFNGSMLITDSERFAKTIGGIGRGKAFGFGMLLLARLDHF